MEGEPPAHKPWVLTCLGNSLAKISVSQSEYTRTHTAAGLAPRILSLHPLPLPQAGFPSHEVEYH